MKDPVAIAAVLHLLPEKPRYPKYGDFTLLSQWLNRRLAYMTHHSYYLRFSEHNRRRYDS
jgi:hypothetical protein